MSVSVQSYHSELANRKINKSREAYLHIIPGSLDVYPIRVRFIVFGLTVPVVIIILSLFLLLFCFSFFFHFSPKGFWIAQAPSEGVNKTEREKGNSLQFEVLFCDIEFSCIQGFKEMYSRKEVDKEVVRIGDHLGRMSEVQDVAIVWCGKGLVCGGTGSRTYPRDECKNGGFDFNTT